MLDRRLPTVVGCGSLPVCGRPGTGGRGVAEEGSVLLEEAVPSSPDGQSGCEVRRAAWAAWSSGRGPHKLSATIEVVDVGERVLGGGRYGTDRAGYRQMLAAGRRWADRVWAV